MMKKSIMMACLGLFSLGAFAQSRPSIIVQAGYQASNMTKMENNKIKSGLRAGVALDFQFVNDPLMELSLQPGLFYSMKGVSFTNKDSKSDAKKNSLTLNYIEVPVLLNARFGLGETMKVFANVGPYFAYGIGGKASFLGLEKEINPFKKHEFAGKSVSIMNRFDAGVHVGAGVEISRILLGLSVQYGLIDTFKSDSKSLVMNDKNVFKNIGFQISAGFRL